MTGADYAGWQITVIQLIVSRAGQKPLQGHMCWTPNCRKYEAGGEVGERVERKIRKVSGVSGEMRERGESK